MTHDELTKAIRLLLGAGLHYAPAASAEVFAAFYSVYEQEAGADLLHAVKRWIRSQVNFPTPVELREYLPEKKPDLSRKQITKQKEKVMRIDPDEWDAVIKKAFGDKFLNDLRKENKNE